MTDEGPTMESANPMMSGGEQQGGSSEQPRFRRFINESKVSSAMKQKFAGTDEMNPFFEVLNRSYEDGQYKTLMEARQKDAFVYPKADVKARYVDDDQKAYIMTLKPEELAKLQTDRMGSTFNLPRRDDYVSMIVKENMDPKSWSTRLQHTYDLKNLPLTYLPGILKYNNHTIGGAQFMKNAKRDINAGTDAGYYEFLLRLQFDDEELVDLATQYLKYGSTVAKQSYEKEVKKTGLIPKYKELGGETILLRKLITTPSVLFGVDWQKGNNAAKIRSLASQAVQALNAIQSGAAVDISALNKEIMEIAGDQHFNADGYLGLGPMYPALLQDGSTKKLQTRSLPATEFESKKGRYSGYQLRNDRYSGQNAAATLVGGGLNLDQRTNASPDNKGIRHIRAQARPIGELPSEYPSEAALTMKQFRFLKDPVLGLDAQKYAELAQQVSNTSATKKFSEPLSLIARQQTIPAAKIASRERTRQIRDTIARGAAEKGKVLAKLQAAAELTGITQDGATALTQGLNAYATDTLEKIDVRKIPADAAEAFNILGDENADLANRYAALLQFINLTKLPMPLLPKSKKVTSSA